MDRTRNYYGGATLRQEFVQRVLLPLCALAFSACVGPGVLHAQMLAGGGPEPSSYTYLEIIEAPGENSVARAVVDASLRDKTPSEEAALTRVLGDLDPSEAQVVKAAALAGKAVELPKRFGVPPPLKVLEAPAPGASWKFTVPPGEDGMLSIEATRDRLSTPVLAFVVRRADHRRSGWVAEVPQAGAQILQLAVLADQRRAVVEVAFDRPRHRTIALYNLDLAAGIARMLDEEGVVRLAHRQIDEARDLFQRAIAVDPTDATAKYNLGCALAIGGRSEEAMSALADALHADPHFLAITARHDPDLDSLRERPDFRALVGPRGEAAEP